jgi:glycosyltransferase involved in cell wall biosynthesis
VKVLLLIHDLYRDIGGGQTVYRKIIETTPDVEFFYFLKNEARTNPNRPGNAVALGMVGGKPRLSLQNIFAPRIQRRALRQAEDFIRTVAGRDFDIVEMPDYTIYGGLVRAALECYGVSVGRTVLAMHGNISDSLRLNWRPAEALDIQRLEHLQFSGADGVYAISQAYIRQWRARLDRPIEYVNPLHFARLPERPLPVWRPGLGGKPDICCLGRLEKRKGNDIFVDLVRWLPTESYGTAWFAGEDQYLSDGSLATELLSSYSSHRGQSAVDYRGVLDWGQLRGVYSGKNVVVLPVRYDALNLMALEALFHGCPLAVSDKAGVCEFLDGEFPGIPYIKIRYKNIYACVDELKDLLDNYDRRRADLHDYLNSLNISLPALDMRGLYRKFLSAPGNARPGDDSLKVDVGEDGIIFGLKSWFAALATAPCRLIKGKLSIKRQVFRKIRRFVNPHAKRDPGDKYAPYLHYFRHMLNSRKISSYRNQPEDSSDDLAYKLGYLYKMAARDKLGRRFFWNEIARIEALRGNHFFSAAYRVRSMRAEGGDSSNHLPYCLETLESHGYAGAAAALRAMHGGDGQDQEGRRVYGYLNRAREANRAKPDLPYEILEDGRGGAEAKVSVIVSLYKAAPKLEFFLSALSRQTLARAGQVELIVQDSASPLDEKAVLDGFLRKTGLPAVYGRSPGRETIQCAWNRGIKLARAPYLVFLGADEGLYPDALEILAAELDRNPGVDWAMGNSLVTEVDTAGVLQKDVMLYDRRGGSKDHAYLETCYLSWVGGMYRKNIHDRFGWYDESFRAAGDTEFKNRILPGIRVAFIPKTLGCFYNYPEARTTASPMAEIEDIQAWYIHRTPGGVRYAFENRPIEDVRDELFRTLGYRKSYCGHISTDFDYGAALARYGFAREGGEWWRDMLGDLTRLRDILVALDCGSGRFCPSLRQYRSLFREAGVLRKKHARSLGELAQPLYRLFNDNRHEQHHWLWKSI